MLLDNEHKEPLAIVGERKDLNLLKPLWHKSHNSIELKVKRQFLSPL